MVTLKNSQLLQIGTSLVSRRPSRPCEIFKRPENREDSSDFDDFLTKMIATTQFFFSKNGSFREDLIGLNIVEIGAILAILRPFELREKNTSLDCESHK